MILNALPRMAFLFGGSGVWGEGEALAIKEFDKNVGRWYFPGMFF